MGNPWGASTPRETDMLAPLDEQFRYHTWATLRVIDHCLELPPDALDHTIPGTMGTIHDTIAHLVGADSWYLTLMTGDDSVGIREAKRLSLRELRARFVESSGVWQRILAHLDDYDPTLPEDGDSPEVPHARNLLLAQALHHGDDHRTHVWSILGAKGLEVPEADVWMYWWSTYLQPAD
jgi:uncharacterized damage-inducible protein DinB